MIIRVTGGLGHQMFQYAFKKELNYLYPNYNIFLDTSYYDSRKIHQGYELKKVFGIEDKIQKGLAEHDFLYKVQKKMANCAGTNLLTSKNIIMELKIGYYPKAMRNREEKTYYDGYWQSEKYFTNVSDSMRQEFEFSPFTEEKNIDLLKILQSEECVSIHVRRGDYLSASQYVQLSNTSYYQDALQVMQQHNSNLQFIILSDDVEWCARYLSCGPNAIYVTWNKGEKSYRDMQIMSLCQHNIIANSSFSWWGAWLNKNPNKMVIAPKSFFKGVSAVEQKIVPDEWLTI